MADLIVTPSLQLKETDILTVDKLNLMATPVVSLSIETPVTDENFFRNGNFYSSFWTTPAGMTCPVGVETTNADYWSINPHGGGVSCKRSTDVPDLYSLWTLELDGVPNVTDCSVGQQINGDLSATLRRPCTWSGYIENHSGGLLSPTLEVWTANTFNGFNACTLQTTVNLQTVSVGAWAYETVTIDLSATGLNNVANGLFIKVRLPSGALSNSTYRINFSRLKFQLGEVATQFVDDPSLFIQTPSVDATMLQDGCIARSTLFMPNVIPAGAYQAGSIHSGDIGAGQVQASNLAAGAATGNLGYTPVNKAGDSGIGKLSQTIDTPVASTAAGAAAILINSTIANEGNDSYMPAIAFNRPNTFARTVGLSTTGRFKTVDQTGKVGYLLDTVTGVDTSSYQPGSITLPALAQSLINILIPAGMVRMFAGPNVPPGWLICDGSAVSRTTYAALWAAIGTYWGPGDAATTFNLPDLRGRVPVGYLGAAAGFSGWGFAGRAGSENHVLSVNEMPNHNHTLHDPGHAHQYDQPLEGVTQAGAGGAVWALNEQRGTTSTNKTDIYLDAVGGGQAFTIMQPFAVLYYIVKY